MRGTEGGGGAWREVGRGLSIPKSRLGSAGLSAEGADDDVRSSLRAQSYVGAYEQNPPRTTRPYPAALTTGHGPLDGLRPHRRRARAQVQSHI